MPRKASRPDSVTTKEGMRKRLTQKPCQTPMARPTASATRIAGTVENCHWVWAVAAARPVR